MFNLFGESEHNVFDYKPIYYDKEEEKRRKMFGAVDGTMEKEKKEGKYQPGSYIRGSMRDGNYQATRSHMKKTQTIIGLITLLLVFIILIFFAKFYMLLPR